MDNFDSGCIICGQPLVYSEENSQHQCAICGSKELDNVACTNGHYICNSCHSEPGLLAISSYALKSTSKNPITVAIGMMAQPGIHMHGPEHHYLVPAALLTAYHNAGYELNLQQALFTAKLRASQVPGGICGNWGTCGAAIGVGIFVSIITKNTPLATKSWTISNLATARALEKIALSGGPRCCKRDTFIAIQAVCEYLDQELDIHLPQPKKIICGFFSKSRDCHLEQCQFYPEGKKVVQ